MTTILASHRLRGLPRRCSLCRRHRFDQLAGEHDGTGGSTGGRAALGLDGDGIGCPADRVGVIGRQGRPRREVGATTEPGKSYELWIVSDRLQRPRSLGVIGSNDFTVRPALASYDTDTVNRATYAVTVEPEGGSPTGVATGPIVFTGKLIETVPPGERVPPR